MGNKSAKLSLPENISLNNVTAIVTGANRGIGYRITFALARMGATVILACRSQEGANEVKISSNVIVKVIVSINETLLVFVIWRG